MAFEIFIDCTNTENIINVIRKKKKKLQTKEDYFLNILINKSKKVLILS